MAEKVDSIVSELRRQGWSLVISSDATNWRATPPDKAKQIVVFSARPHDTVRVLRDLRHQGFVWPPHANGHLDASARISSTPFPPRPHPDATVEPREAIPPPPPPVASSNPVDALAFVKLREAKEYERVAAADLVKCNDELRATTARAEAARAAYDDALAALKKAKAAFDAAFSPESEGGIE